ncbi:hypothetical protein [Bradyrhizobium sp. LMTR 3]|uniref:hypothetical protein n=1 Tax=Bradyrhizobium sp. LMTR 3 TaxID=189873 RepID=UPI0011473D5E|nr:hypothetical protein [Bradyrhizobium sp. LMTR 3]
MDVDTKATFRRETLRASQKTANPGLIKLVTDRYFKRGRNGRYLLGESVSDLLNRVKAQKREDEPRLTASAHRPIRRSLKVGVGKLSRLSNTAQSSRRSAACSNRHLATPSIIATGSSRYVEARRDHVRALSKRSHDPVG